MQPKTHEADFLIPGLCSYESDGEGVWLFQKNAIDDSAASFIGKPVQVGHEANAPAVGYVCGISFDSAKGVYSADFFLLDEKAEQMVTDGEHFPSCYYTVESVGDGGVYNDIAYGMEVLKARFDHLAIVDSPRYSCGAFHTLSAQNSAKVTKIQSMDVNPGGKMTLFKKTAKNEDGDKTKETETPAPAPAAAKTDTAAASESSVADAVVEIDGKTVPLDKLVEHWKKTSEAENEKVISENESVDIDGVLVKVSDLITRWKESPAVSENESEPEEEELEEKEEEKEEAENGKKCSNSKPKGGIDKVRKAVTASNSVQNFNNRCIRNASESKNDYNQRMTEVAFGAGGK